MILVLRPEGKAQHSAALLNANGHDAMAIAAISIQKNQLQVERLTTALKSENYPDGLIVTSTYAASMLLDIVKLGNIKTENLPVFCVGTSCQEILSTIFKYTYTGIEQTSEGLIAHLLLSKERAAGKQYFLLKGEQGRDFLPSILRSRGADLMEFDLYKRIKHPTLIKRLDCAKQQINCIIATSQELCELILENQPIVYLRSITWIVVSERIRKYLLSKGIKSIFTSNGAQPEALLACVRQWKER